MTRMRCLPGRSVALCWTVSCFGWCIAAIRSMEQEGDGNVTQPTVGLLLDEDILTDVLSGITLLTDQLQECCGTKSIVKSHRAGAHVDEITELLQLTDAGIVTMASCEVTSFVCESAEYVGVQHIGMPRGHCDNKHTLCPTTYYIAARPSNLYAALTVLISHVRSHAVHIIYDHSFAKDHELQQLVLSLSALGVSVRMQFFTSSTKTNRTMLIEHLIGNYVVNIVTFLEHRNLMDILQLAADRNLTNFMYRWMVCGEPVYFADLDLKPWVESNFILLSTRLVDMHGVPNSASNRKSQVFVGLALGCMLAVELSQPGSLNWTNQYPPQDCALSSLSTFSSLREQATWTARNRDSVFGADGYVREVVVDVWGVTNSTDVIMYTPRRPVHITLKATWSATSGLSVHRQRLFPFTVFDFGNDLFKIAVYEARPFVIKIEDSNRTITYEGLCIDMLKEISKYLNFRYELVEPPDKVYGSPVTGDVNGEWSGMIGMVMREEIPMAVGPFTVSAARAQAVDFTTPFMNDKAGIVVHRPQAGGDATFQILHPFSQTVWLAIAVAIFVVGILLFCVDQAAAYVSRRDRSFPKPLSLPTYIWNMFGEYLEQNADYQPRPLAARGLVVCWWLFAIIMSSTYTANLAALYTVVISPSHIESLGELARSPTVQPLVQPGSFLDDFFKQHNTPDQTTVEQRLKNLPDMPVRAAKALSLVKASDRYVFMSDSTQLAYWASEDCQYLTMAREGFGPQSSFAFPVPKNSRYLPALNQIIIKFQESGLMDRWHTRWWKPTSSCSTTRSVPPTSIQLPGIAGSFIVFLVSVGLCLCALVVEKCTDNILRKIGHK